MKLNCLNILNGKEISLPLEQVVKLLLPSNISTNFHLETLKSQAIIIRTNLLRKANYLGKKDSINIDPSILQSNDNINKIKKACKDTEGIVILYNNKPIDAKYHICCGGSTENMENVFGNSVVYLRKVLCNYCKDSPYVKGEKVFTLEEIEKKLGVKFLPANSTIVEISNLIDNIELDDEDRVVSLKIGNKTFKGTELMDHLGFNSTRFKIYLENIKFIFRGYGHGLGFCQYGGEKMAQLGKDYKEILEYYYTGIEIKKIPLPCIEKPIYGKIIIIDPGHGGEDTGYEGVNLGLKEKDISLKLAKTLKSQLENMGATVCLTRERDEKILIANRIKKTNKLQGDFFLSIHLDYYPNSTKKGFEIFYFKDDLEAKALGELILKKLKSNSIPTRGIKEGNYYLFRKVRTSALLMEIGYLSSKEDEFNLNKKGYIFKIAEAIRDGILDYFFSY